MGIEHALKTKAIRFAYIDPSTLMEEIADRLLATVNVPVTISDSVVNANEVVFNFVWGGNEVTVWPGCLVIRIGHDAILVIHPTIIKTGEMHTSTLHRR